MQIAKTQIRLCFRYTLRFTQQRFCAFFFLLPEKFNVKSATKQDSIQPAHARNLYYGTFI